MQEIEALSQRGKERKRKRKRRGEGEVGAASQLPPAAGRRQAAALGSKQLGRPGKAKAKASTIQPAGKLVRHSQATLKCPISVGHSKSLAAT